MLQSVAPLVQTLAAFGACCGVLRGVAGSCKMLQGFEGCCCVLQCVTVCCFCRAI